MKTLTTLLFQQLLQEENTLCLSVYVPVGKEVSDVNANILRLKNLIKDINSTFKDNAELENILQRLEKETKDSELFKGHEGCIGFFISASDIFEMIYLPACSDAFYQVDHVFYIVPLIDLIPKLQNHHVLSLGRNSVRMYKGNFYGIKEITLSPDIPLSMKDALGSDLTDNHLHAAAGGSATLHGYMEITEEKEVDNERFFHIIDQLIYENYSQKENISLHLATISENAPLFNKISKNPNLNKEYMDLSESTASINDIHQALRKRIADEQLRQIQEIVTQFQLAKSEKLVSEQLREVAEYTIDGRVKYLLLGKGRKIYGDIFLDKRTVKVDTESPKDILNGLAIMAYKTGSQNYIIHPEQLPLIEGAASINRY